MDEPAQFLHSQPHEHDLPFFLSFLIVLIENNTIDNTITPAITVPIKIPPYALNLLSCKVS